MNKAETIKAEKAPLSICDEIPAFARDGWESIPETDRDIRLKWAGLFYRQQTPGHFMMRIRVPAGITNAAQIRTVAAIAERYGRGTLDLTTRQQIQLRWLRIEDIPAVLQSLNGAGLLTLQTGYDNIRGVMTCPVAGLTPNELFDASPAARAFNDIFVGNPEFANLPRKFNATLTGCLENCTHAESQDVGMTPAAKDVDGETLIGFNVTVGGKMGSGGLRVGRPLDAFVTPEEAPLVAAAIALVFRDHGSRETRNRARLCFLIDEWGIARFRSEVEARAGMRLRPAGHDPRTGVTTDHIGVHPQRQPGLSYAGLLVPVGRATAAHMHELARIAETYGDGEIRLTPEQNVIVPNVADPRLEALLAEPLLQELQHAPSEIMRGTVSCTGIEYCGMATIATKEHALNLALAIDAAGGATRPISVGWSGCPASCGNHQAADIGLLGRKKKIDGVIVEAVDIYIGGTTGPSAVPGVKILEGIPCDQLTPVVEQLIHYGAFKHLRQQLLGYGHDD